LMDNIFFIIGNKFILKIPKEREELGIKIRKSND